MPISSEELIALHPTLFHVSLASWEQVEEQGLLSASSLLDFYGKQGRERATLEREPRKSVQLIRHPLAGATALLNDQSPWTESVQRRCKLPDDMLVADWMQYLNGHVFFWPTWERLEVFYYAIRAKERKRMVLEVNTRSLLDRVGDGILLSSQNSGAPHGGNPSRRVKFSTLEAYPFDDWAKRRRSKYKAITEIVIPSKVSLAGLFVRSNREPKRSLRRER